MADIGSISCRDIPFGTLFGYGYETFFICVWLGDNRFLTGGRVKQWYPPMMARTSILIEAKDVENENG